MTLADYLIEHKEGPPPQFGPVPLSLDTFPEVIETSFVEVGMLEHVDESLRRIARALNRQYDPPMLSVENRVVRDQDVTDDMRESFVERHPLEYAIYDYVARKFGGDGGSRSA